MYVAVKGGEKAIKAAHDLLAKKRRGSHSKPAIDVAQIQDQLSLAVDRVMNEASVYDKELAALAIKQSSGDLVEAIFLLRAYRTTLSRFMIAEPIETNKMQIRRRISAIYKDVPGGQLLGPTYDYTHRLLDFKLLAESAQSESTQNESAESTSHHASLAQSIVDSTADSTVESTPHKHSAIEEILLNKLTEPTRETQDQDNPNYSKVLDILEAQSLLNPAIDDHSVPPDITREPVIYPCNRQSRLQQLIRGDEGFLLALGYSTQRGYGRNHPFAGEIRTGNIEIEITPEELGFTISIGELEITECEMITGFTSDNDTLPHFTQGYGLVFGSAERKAMSMAIVDRSLQTKELEEQVLGPAQDEEFVLAHLDNVDAAGFISHLKLPHYVDFQAELSLIRQMQNEFLNEGGKGHE